MKEFSTRISRNEAVTAVAGRILLSSIFLLSGINKIMSFSTTASMMDDKGIFMAPLALTVAICVEVLCGIGLLTGIFARVSSLLLFLFLIPTTLIFHNFWDAPAAQAHMQQISFMKNLAIMGGLLIVAGLGPGPMSVMNRSIEGYDLDVQHKREKEETLV